MGTISEKLSYLNNTKTLLKNRLNSIGASITNSTKFRDYLVWLDTFYSEVSNKTDLSVNGIVGRTNQATTTGKNMLDISKFVVVYPNRGITCELNDDGSVTLNGTATSQSDIRIYSNDERLIVPSGKTITLSRSSNKTNFIWHKFISESGATQQDVKYMGAGGVNTFTYTTVDDYGFTFTIRVPKDTTLNNLKFYLQLEEGSTSTDWERYTNGPSPNPSFPQMVNNLTGNVTYTATINNDEETFTIPLGDIELCEIDTYKDKIYSSNGKFYLYKETIKYNLFELSYAYNGSSTTPVNRTVLAAYDMGLKTTYFCNIAKSSLQTDSSIPNRIVTNQGNIGTWFVTFADDLTGITSNDDNNTKISKIINFLQNKNAVLITYLSSPTTTEITSSNYPELYAALKEIQDYLTTYKINNEFILGASSPTISY